MNKLSDRLCFLFFGTLLLLVLVFYQEPSPTPISYDINNLLPYQNSREILELIIQLNVGFNKTARKEFIKYIVSWSPTYLPKIWPAVQSVSCIHRGPLRKRPYESVLYLFFPPGGLEVPFCCSNKTVRRLRRQREARKSTFSFGLWVTGLPEKGGTNKAQ